MGLDHNELVVAAYLYGTHLMYIDEEDIVFSSAITVQRDVFRSLLPGKPIYDEVLILIVDMMRNELPTQSGYWFLPPSFAKNERIGMDPTRLEFHTTDICMGKVDYLKRVFIPVDECNKEGDRHWYLVVVDRVAMKVILLDPKPTEFQHRRRRTAINLATYLEKAVDDRRFYDFETTPYFSTVGYEFVEPTGLLTLEDASNDAALWVATWMITCVDGTNFSIKVDVDTHMKIAVSLVLKNHNIYNEKIKTKAIEDLQSKYANHDRYRDDIYRN